MLVVEFDSLQRDVIVLTLERSGFQVVICEELSEIREQIKEYQPGALIVDLHLPGHNSLELLRGLYGEGYLARRTVLAISALGFKEVVERSRSAGVDDFLVKPIRPDTLLSRVLKAFSL